MIRLLKIELNKTLYSRQIWIILGLYIVLLVPVAFAIDSINFGGNSGEIPNPAIGTFTIFNHPTVWHNMAYLFTWFQLFLGIIVISLVANEFSQKTLRQNIIDGLTKWEVIASKEIVIVLLSFFSTILLVLLTLILGNSSVDVSIWEGFNAVPAYFICILLYLNFAYFISFWVKKSGLAIGLLLIYSLIIENLLTWKLPDNIGTLFPMQLGSNMIPNPMGGMLNLEATINLSPLNIGMTLVYIGLFLGLIFWMLKKGHAAK
ncbi:MAG: hypothetical protein COA58_05730 [Bacteroidetes bacterium]|nr:MAG: hypothetical protein COA58_05730 [Bacteroidota bacterium]